MPDLEKLFPGRFIKASEFGGKAWTVTIADVQPEKVKSHVNGGKEETLAVMWITESERNIHLCKTNATCIAAMFGRDYQAWPGHKLTLFPDKDTSGLSDSGFCIRVKGSPEITQRVTAKIKNPGRGEPKERILVPTGSTPAAEPSLLEGGDE